MTTSAAARDQHLDELRALMAAHSPPIHALLVPSEDAHQVLTPAARADRNRSDPAGLDCAGLRVL
jgi:Xaa-Pro aminopeptidase